MHPWQRASVKYRRIYHASHIVIIKIPDSYFADLLYGASLPRGMMTSSVSPHFHYEESHQVPTIYIVPLRKHGNLQRLLREVAPWHATFNGAGCAIIDAVTVCRFCVG